MSDLPSRTDKPWGHELLWAKTDQYVGKVLHVEAGQRLSVQYHDRKDESNLVLRGRLKLLRGTSADDLTETIVGEGDCWRNRAGEVHTIEAIEDADVVEVSTPQLDDVVRLEDGYGREGTSAP